MIKQTLKLFEDRVKQNTDDTSTEIYYKKMLLMHGAYLLFNVVNNNVCAAGVVNNGFVYGSSPWAKIEIIACHQFEKGYGKF